MTAPTLPSAALAGTSASFTVAESCGTSSTAYNSHTGGYVTTTWDYSTAETITAPVSRTATYTARNYCVFNQIIIKIPSYVTVNSMTTLPLAQSWSKAMSTDGNDWVYTIIMVPTTNQMLGAIANFVLQAEDGTVKSYYLSLS